MLELHAIHVCDHLCWSFLQNPQPPQVSGLSLPEQFTLVNAPIDPFDPKQRRAFLEFTAAYAEGQPVLFNAALMPAGPPASELQMADAESLHKVGGRCDCVLECCPGH
jgi:hypothetical protein